MLASLFIYTSFSPSNFTLEQRQTFGHTFIKRSISYMEIFQSFAPSHSYDFYNLTMILRSIIAKPDLSDKIYNNNTTDIQHYSEVLMEKIT